MLAPGETLDRAAREGLAAMFHAEARLDIVLLPLRPAGASALERAATTYLSRWDRRFVHRMTVYAPAARVAVRDPAAAKALAAAAEIAGVPAWTNAAWAPLAAGAIAAGRLVEARADLAVATPIARDLEVWREHFRAQGRAWGRLAARDAGLARFAPPPSRAAWWRHNVRQVHRRLIEVLEGTSSASPLVIGLHVVREAAFTAGASQTF